MKIPITDQFIWDVYNFFERRKKFKDFLCSPIHKKFDVLLDLDNPIFRKYKDDKNRRKFSNMMYYLKTKNYIKIQNLKSKKGVIITKNGLSKALKASFICSDIPKRKDGKFIMIIFDIPKTHKISRNMLKSILYNLKYKLLQQSVWVTPYDVLQKTENLLQLHSLDKYVKIFIIEKI